MERRDSGGIILDQLKKLGCSCDWSRTRFTMDKDLSRAVIKVFVDLYNAKLIFKDKKLVNWDTHLQTCNFRFRSNSERCSIAIILY